MSITALPPFELLDLSPLSESQRLAFYGALFAMSDADRSMDTVETDRIYDSLNLQGLSPESRKEVLAQAIHPPPLERCLLQFRGADEEYRRGLMLNLIDIVLADESIEPGEHLGLHQARVLLDLSLDDMASLHEMAYSVQASGGDLAIRRPLRPYNNAPIVSSGDGL